ncbi:MAG: peptidoglycan DD-metalloendopeptidase family protein, partial [Pseudomonadota bacterium]
MTYNPGETFEKNSNFGQDRGTNGIPRLHYGEDWRAPSGTDIPAAAAGTVWFTGTASGYGNVVVLRHEPTDGEPYFTLYGHLDTLDDVPSVGTEVDKDELIGTVGSTGVSSGPHLHFEVIDGDTAINNASNGTNLGVRGSVGRLDPSDFNFGSGDQPEGARTYEEIAAQYKADLISWIEDNLVDPVRAGMVDALSNFPGTPDAEEIDSLLQQILDSMPGPNSIPGWLENSLNLYFNAARTLAVDPLVLDLNADGIRLISLASSNAQFDIDGDGFSERTGWVEATDGLLAIDNNHDGIVNDISELIGNASETGFAVLGRLDENNDSVIDSADSIFADLIVWQDLDGDGKSDAGELRPLSDYGISAINLNTINTNLNIGGNLISESGTFLANGVSKQAVSVWFAVNQTLSAYDPGSSFSTPYVLDHETLALPQLKGSGTISPMFMAASRDPELKLLLQHFADTEPGYLAETPSAIESILFRWAEVNDTVPGSRGTQFDAKVIEFLEAYFGQEYVQQISAAGAETSDPTGRSVTLLENAYGSLFEALSVRLLIQGPLSDVFGDVVQDPISGTLTTMSSSADLIDRLFGGVTGQSDIAALSKLVLGSLVLRHLFPEDQNLASDLATRISDTAADNGWAPFIDAMAGSSILAMGSALYDGATPGSVFLTGGGNEILRGAAGNDMYVFGGQGTIGFDSVSDNGGFDAIFFGEGIAPSDVVLRGTTDGNLYLTLAGTSEGIFIQRQLQSGAEYAQVEQVRFADGTVWDLLGGLALTGT